MWPSLKLGFHNLHRLLRQFHPGLRGRGHHRDRGMFAFPSPGPGILDHGVQRIEQGSIPVWLSNAPTPFDRIVFAVVRRRIGQTDGEVVVLHKLHQALHELGAPTVALRTMVQVHEQGRDVGKALFDALPPVDQPIHQAIAGHFGRHPLAKELIGGREENPHRRHLRRWVNVVVGCPGGYAALATTSTRADLDASLGIHREP